MKDYVRRSEFIRNLQKSQIHEGMSGRDSNIYTAVKRILKEGSVYFVIVDTPEQDVDILRVLVDDAFVVGFELPRGGEFEGPINSFILSVEEYRKKVGAGQKKIHAAIELAREALDREAQRRADH